MSDEAFEELQEKLEMLKEVRTQEDLDRIKTEIEKAKQRALAESPAYRQLIAMRQAEAEARAAALRSKYDDKIHEVQLRVDKAKAEADKARMDAEAQANASMTGHFPTSVTLTCPKCGGTNLNWMVNGKGKHKKTVPWCFKCNVKMVAKGETRFIRAIRPDEAVREALGKLRGQPI